MRTPEDERDEAGEEQEPGDQLMPGSRLKKPDLDVEQKQSQDSLPGKEAVEAVRAGTRRDARET